MLLEKDYFFFCDVDGLCGHISLEGGGGGGAERGSFLVKIVIMKVMRLASKKWIYRSEGLGLHRKELQLHVPAAQE